MKASGAAGLAPPESRNGSLRWRRIGEEGCAMLAQAEALGARFSDSILAEAGEALRWIA
jgi:hypothetical protein